MYWLVQGTQRSPFDHSISKIQRGYARGLQAHPKSKNDYLLSDSLCKKFAALAPHLKVMEGKLACTGQDSPEKEEF